MAEGVGPPRPGKWARHAACAGLMPAHDARLPDEEADADRFRARVAAARERCSRCPVLAECAAWTMALPRTHRSGVLAGRYYPERSPRNG